MSDEKEHNRQKDIQPRPLNPETLVGSWFHKLDSDEGLFEFQGFVVAEPQPGVYLLEIHDWFTGDVLYGRLFGIEQFVKAADCEWRFYDTREKMKSAQWREDASRTWTNQQERDRLE